MWSWNNGLHTSNRPTSLWNLPWTCLMRAIPCSLMNQSKKSPFKWFFCHLRAKLLLWDNACNLSLSLSATKIWFHKYSGTSASSNFTAFLFRLMLCILKVGSTTFHYSFTALQWFCRWKTMKGMDTLFKLQPVQHPVHDSCRDMCHELTYFSYFHWRVKEEYLLECLSVCTLSFPPDATLLPIL